MAHPKDFLLALSLAVLLSAAGTTACKTPQEELVGKPPAEGEIGRPLRSTDPIHVTGKPLRTEGPRHPEPLFAIEGWPYNDEGKNFTLTWEYEEAAVPVYSEPDPNAERVGEVVLNPGERIAWTQSWVSVYRPAVFQVKKEVLVEGVVHQDGYRTGNDFFSRTLAIGEPVAVYHYAGSGLCYLGVGQQIAKATCPTPQHFQGPFLGPTLARQMQPVESIWWVRIQRPGVSGWIPLDDRVVVDIQG